MRLLTAIPELTGCRGWRTSLHVQVSPVDYVRYIELVQRFELPGRRFTNFRYYYYHSRISTKKQNN